MTGKIQLKNNLVFVKNYLFTNLAQYPRFDYYLSIPDAFNTAGVPSSATVISLVATTWTGLGTSFYVVQNGTGGIYVLYTYQYSISSSSAVGVKFSYIL